MKIFEKIKNFFKKKETPVRAEDISILSQINPQKAEKILIDYIKRNKRIPHFVYIYLGNIYRYKGKYEDALRTHKIILSEPNLSREEKQQIYKEICIDYIKLGKFEKTKEFLKKIEDRDIKDDILKELLKSYIEKGAWENGLEIFEKLKIGNKEEIYSIAYISTKNEKFAKKIKETNSPIVLFALSLYHKNKGNYKKTFQYHIEILKNFPKYSFLIIDDFQNLMFEEGKFGEILTTLSNIENPWAKFINLIILTKMGEKDKVSEIVEDILQSKPDILLLKKIYEFLKLYGEYKDILKIADKIIEKSEEIWICKVCGYKTKEFNWICPSCLSISSFILSDAISSTASSV
ncbi:hypothetical protein DRN73_07800 [Candidatus Pacearchaeota archaeon]|nr:MAG: hypothetical protein DRN73_07800 [Candidatus Pacearchaeota archaeon]